MSPFCLIDVARLREDATAPARGFHALFVRLSRWVRRLRAMRAA